jgi:hypothetical protein
MVSSTLSIVIITTLIFATFMGHAQRLWAPIVKSDHSIDAHDNLTDVSHYELIVHPNEEKVD